jgi:hypothetical protein
VKLQEAENQIVIDYEVYARRPNDAELLIPSIAAHAAKLGRVPRLVAADASFYSANNEAAAQARGVKRVCIPNRSCQNDDAYHDSPGQHIDRLLRRRQPMGRRLRRDRSARST